MRGYGLAIGKTARFISPLLNAVPSSCRINFWYHMFGKGMGTLRIYVRARGTDTKVTTSIR